MSFKFTNLEHKLKFKLHNLYAYCRDKVAPKFVITFYSWLAYAFAAAVPVILVPFYTYKYALMPNGHTDGVYSAGFASFTALITIHHLHTGLQIRNWTWLVVIFFVVSILWFMPIAICRNNWAITAGMYQMTFTSTLREP